MSKLKRAAWYVAAAAGGILVPTLVYSAIIENEYVTRPRAPTPENGWTVPHAVKGITVYVSPREDTVATWLYRLDLCLFGAIVVCGIVGVANSLGSYRPNQSDALPWLVRGGAAQRALAMLGTPAAAETYHGPRPALHRPPR